MSNKDRERREEKKERQELEGAVYYSFQETRCLFAGQILYPPRSTIKRAVLKDIVEAVSLEGTSHLGYGI